MNVEIIPKNLKGTIKAISSKSNAHRVLICSAFSKNTVKLILETTNVDIDTTMECLESLGAEFIKDKEKITVIPIEKIVEDATLNCRESGSTLRFILPVSSAVSSKNKIIGQGRLPERPLKELIDQMKEHGVNFSSDFLPLVTEGKLEPGEFKLPGNVSSQYITGLLLAAPLTNKDVKISLTSPLESKGYVNMTLDTMRDFNIEVEELESGYFVKGGQSYYAEKNFQIEGDWSNAAFFLCAGALGGKVNLTNLKIDSSQGDREVVNILRSFGANIAQDSEGLSISPGELKGISIDVSEIPDLLPILSIVATVAKGKTEFVNAARVRIKESDRLSAMYNIINALGGKAEEFEDRLVVHGSGKLKGGVVDSYNDHRIVMSAAIASIICEEKVIINGAEAVNKSYPKFFEDFKSLGGEVNVLDFGK